MNTGESDSLSVFVPFYNEEELAEKTVREIHDFLERSGLDYELILVDDGSTDQTFQLIEGFAEHPRIDIVRHDKNQGYGRALATGFSESSKDMVFYMDGDGQFDISELELFLDHADKADILTGYREKREDDLGRIIIADNFNRLARTVLPIDVRDIDCGFKLVHRDVLEDIELETQRTVDAELLAKAQDKGYSVKELPVSHRKREGGVSEAEGILGVRTGLILKTFQELFTIWRSIR
ncbi:MAG: glycosyltransferase family 2 protein [Candidatus Nanohaloarchaea archaeon]